MKSISSRWGLLLVAFGVVACGASPSEGPPEGADGAEPENTGSIAEALTYGNHGFAWVAFDAATSQWKVQNNFSWGSGSVAFPTVTHDGTGLYTVTFSGLNAAYTGAGYGGNVQVVATNQGGTGSVYNNTRCKVEGWGLAPTLEIYVACHGTSGAFSDSPFVVHYFQQDAGTFGKSGYVWSSGNPSSDPPYSPASTWSGNTTGGLNTVDRTGVGLYTVTFGGLAAPLCGVYPPCYGGNPQITAYGSSAHYCKVSGWTPSGSDQQVFVRCYDGTGALADSLFSLNFDHRPSSPFGIGAHAWASSLTAPSYTPSAAYSYNSDKAGFGTGTNLALRQSRGVYQMRHFGLENNKAAPHVSAYGSDNLHCKIEKWGVIPGTLRDVQVETRCWAPTGGAPQDSLYQEVFISRRGPDGSDFDGDGFTPAEGDCNDGNVNVYPGAEELCNDVDDDCDSVIDEGVTCALAVTGGALYTCALLNGGRVKCWGYNALGNLGLGDTAARGGGPGEMGASLPVVDFGTGRTATAIAAGSNHTCAVLDNGQVKCWGLNTNGQLGLGDTANRGDGAGEMGNNLPAVNLGTGRTATALDLGWAHSCALLDNAQVKCWGRNIVGELGQGDLVDRGDNAGEMGDALPAVSLGTGRSAVALELGQFFACVVLDNAQLKCWGYNPVGQLGLGDALARGDGPGEMGDALPFVSLGTGRTVLAVNAGGSSACALLDNMQIKCWGANSIGQLGLGDTTHRGLAPLQMGDGLPFVSLGTGRSATAVSNGDFHTCALLDNGQLKCWGENTSGELGLGDTAHRGDAAGEMGDALPAVSLGTGRTGVSLGLGQGHGCAVLDNTQLKCWGRNAPGQLGLGDNASRGDGPGEMGDSLPPVSL